VFLIAGCVCFILRTILYNIAIGIVAHCSDISRLKIYFNPYRNIFSGECDRNLEINSLKEKANLGPLWMMWLRRYTVTSPGLQITKLLLRREVPPQWELARDSRDWLCMGCLLHKSCSSHQARVGPDLPKTPLLNSHQALFWLTLSCRNPSIIILFYFHLTCPCSIRFLLQWNSKNSSSGCM
jgi:hypothetical protein